MIRGNDGRRRRLLGGPHVSIKSCTLPLETCPLREISKVGSCTTELVCTSTPEFDLEDREYWRPVGRPAPRRRIPLLFRTAQTRNMNLESDASRLMTPLRAHPRRVHAHAVLQAIYNVQNRII
jgi:hypothetical protein